MSFAKQRGGAVERRACRRGAWRTGPLSGGGRGCQDFVVAFVVRDLAVVAWMDSSAIPGFAQPGEAGEPQFAAGRLGRMGPIRVSWSDTVSLG